jgi:bifunctional enzyme CysN/CysC
MPDIARNHTDIDRYLEEYFEKDLLRFITCGSVDDGKSTLIGRLLYESKLVYDDTLAKLRADSERRGAVDGAIDFSLLLDGLSAERAQGITIDVAYRYFATAGRMFIVADTPGHEQYTRNMVTGASTADLAIVLLDVTKGVRTQTKRHTYLCWLLGIRTFVLVVNKMDMVGFSQQVFDDIVAEYSQFVDELGVDDFLCIPVSALYGDNLVSRSAIMEWYDGPALLEYLEHVDVGERELSFPFRMWTQTILRLEDGSRAYAGLVGAGAIDRGDEVRISPKGIAASVARIIGPSGDLEHAVANQSVGIVLNDDFDVSRGDLLAQPSNTLNLADKFEARVVWMSEDPLIPGRSYLLKIGTLSVGVTVEAPRYKINVNSLEHVATHHLEMNEIGVCHLTTDKPIPFDPYEECRSTGAFIIVDRLTSSTAGAGMISFGLRRSHNVSEQRYDTSRQQRSVLKGHRPAVLWMTGLSGAGKSTIANLLEQQMCELGIHAYVLDGDNLRRGLNQDLGFTVEDRVENVRRVAEVAKLMADAGIVVIVALISPFEADRRMAKELIGADTFVEVYVEAPLETVEARDVKGLYQKARSGEIPNFTGINSPYDAPEHPDVLVHSATLTPQECAQIILDYLLLDRNLRSL